MDLLCMVFGIQGGHDTVRDCCLPDRRYLFCQSFWSDMIQSGALFAGFLPSVFGTPGLEGCIGHVRLPAQALSHKASNARDDAIGWPAGLAPSRIASKVR